MGVWDKAFMAYVPPQYAKDGFSCPHCSAFAQQDWWFNLGELDGRTSPHPTNNKIAISRCRLCRKDAVWWQSSMLHPNNGAAPSANPDLPEEVRKLYEEAASISTASPRGAAALLRLAIQHLCVQLGGKGKDINADIGLLVSKGLPEKVQMALDVVRVIGNHAVHPGQIDTDDPKAVGELFVLLNLIAEYMISMPNKVSSLYGLLPQDARDAIEKRDGKTPATK